MAGNRPSQRNQGVSRDEEDNDDDAVRPGSGHGRRGPGERTQAQAAAVPECSNADLTAALVNVTGAAGARWVT